MSVTSSLTRIRSAAVRTAIAAAVVGTTVMAGLLGAAGPAHASGTNDYVLINTARIDLGLLVDPFNDLEFIAPGAPVRWQANAAAGTYQPYLSGVMSMKNAIGFCGKIRIEAFTISGARLDDAESTAICPTSNSRTFGPAEPTLVALNQSDVHRVRVSALIRFYVGGIYMVQSTKDVYPYD